MTVGRFAEHLTMRRAGQAAYHDPFLDVFGRSLKDSVVTDLPPLATLCNIR
jgi:hypothetical protein